MIPPYFPQENKYTCSLAVLRMVLATHGIQVTEKELVNKVTPIYGKAFKNIWNATIAKLACQYGVKITMFARWPLFKKNVMAQALKEYTKTPNGFNFLQYENKNDKDELSEPMIIAYREMFEAVKAGCNYYFGGLTKNRTLSLLAKGYLIHTLVKLHKLYPGKRHTFHGILLYKVIKDTVYYHDPTWGESLSCSIDALLKSTQNVGAFIVYNRGIS